MRGFKVISFWFLILASDTAGSSIWAPSSAWNRYVLYEDVVKALFSLKAGF